MEKIFLSFSLLIVFIFFPSCEQPLEEEEFPYEMKLIVRGIIEPGKIIEDIYIGRTLPVGVTFNEDFANLKDAIGAVISDEVFYPLRHIENGIYTTDSLVAQKGKRYSLLVYYQDRAASAETYIPIQGSIVGYGIKNIQDNGNGASVMEGIIIPRGEESYTASWVLVNFNGNINRESEIFAEVVTASSGEELKVITDKIPPNILNSTSGDLGIRVYIYDRAFYDFFRTQGSAQITDAIFGQPGTNVRWNVAGEGIGLFIGRTDTILIR